MLELIVIFVVCFFWGAFIALLVNAQERRTRLTNLAITEEVRKRNGLEPLPASAYITI